MGQEVAARREVLAKLPERWVGPWWIRRRLVAPRSWSSVSRLLRSGNRASCSSLRRRRWRAMYPCKGNTGEVVCVLGTDEIDLLQIHNVHGARAAVAAVQGSTRRPARSATSASVRCQDNQYPQLGEARKKYDFDFVQVDYSIDNRTAEADVFRIAQTKGMGVLVNTPLGGRRGGNLMSRASRKSYRRELRIWISPAEGAVLPEVRRVAPCCDCYDSWDTRLSHLEDNQKAARGRLPNADQR